jgi:hypothetical protein
LQPAPKAKADNMPYIVMLVVMSALIVASIVLLEVYAPADKDNTSTIALIIGFGGTLTATIMTFLKADKAETQAIETHLMVNSRLSQMIENAKAASHAEGEVVGRNDANARTDGLAAIAADGCVLKEKPDGSEKGQ